MALGFIALGVVVLGVAFAWLVGRAAGGDHHVPYPVGGTPRAAGLDIDRRHVARTYRRAGGDR